MKVAIIGAGRNRNGIGGYIAKYFHQNGATVTAILGSTDESAKNASHALKKYGIASNPFSDFYEMVETERPDSIVIASPSPTHYEYLQKCITVGANIFCEKPFCFPETDDVLNCVEGIFQKAENHNIIVAMNSQWSFAIPCYERLCGPIDKNETREFFMRLSPMSSGKQMIPESIPHALSILYSVLGNGDIEHIRFESNQETMTIMMRYVFDKGACDAIIHFKHQPQQPRELSFGFNQRIVQRVLKMETYEMYFKYENEVMQIIDPLDLSVRDFINAVKEQREPLVGYSHIVHNMVLMKKIYDCYEES